jgi:hypothetical protein
MGPTSSGVPREARHERRVTFLVSTVVVDRVTMTISPLANGIDGA